MEKHFTYYFVLFKCCKVKLSYNEQIITTGVRYNRVNLCIKMTNLHLNYVLYNQVRYNRVSLYYLSPTWDVQMPPKTKKYVKNATTVELTSELRQNDWRCNFLGRNFEKIVLWYQFVSPLTPLRLHSFIWPHLKTSLFSLTSILP